MTYSKKLKWYKAFLHDHEWKVIKHTRVSAYTKDLAKEIARIFWKLEDSTHITIVTDIPQCSFIFRDNIQHIQDQQPTSPENKTL